MSRKALAVVANAIAVLVVGLGAVAAQAGIVGDVVGGLPDLDGEGGTDLPGGGNINLPGGGSNGGVTLPGGGGTVPLPGGGGSTPAVPSTPVTPPSAPTPPDGGGETGEDGGEEGSDGATAGGGGKGGKGQGHAENDDKQTAAEKREEENRVDDQIRQPDGVPTAANPTLSLATFGPSPIGMPNFIIDRFTIPPFLLPIYQACGTEYGVPVVRARIDQPDRDRFRHQPERLNRGRPGLDAVHAGHLEGVRGRRQQRRAQGSLQPGRRDLRGGELSGGLRRAGRPPRSDLRLQPRRLVRRRGSPLCPPVREHPQRPRQLDHWPDRGCAVPGRGERPLRGRRVRARREGRQPSFRRRRPAAGSTSTPRKARPRSR